MIYHFSRPYPVSRSGRCQDMSRPHTNLVPKLAIIGQDFQAPLYVWFFVFLPAGFSIGFPLNQSHGTMYFIICGDEFPILSGFIKFHPPMFVCKSLHFPMWSFGVNQAPRGISKFERQVIPEEGTHACRDSTTGRTLKFLMVTSLGHQSNHKSVDVIRCH